MNERIDNELMLYAVRHYRRQGFAERIRLLLWRSKQLAFKETNRPLTDQEIDAELRCCRYNLGLKLGDGLMLIDKDGPNVGCFGAESNFAVAASRGRHEYFLTEMSGKNAIKID